MTSEHRKIWLYLQLCVPLNVLLMSIIQKVCKDMFGLIPLAGTMAENPHMKVEVEAEDTMHSHVTGNGGVSRHRLG